MRSFDEFLARTLCHGGDGAGGGGAGGEDYANYNESYQNGGGFGGPGGYAGGPWSGDDNGASIDGMGGRAAPAADVAAGRAAQGWDTSYTGEQAGRGWQGLKDQTNFANTVGRGIANFFTGFVGLNNPGPKAVGNGLTASPGFQFNPGALAGSWIGLGTGVPGLNTLGAMAWDNSNKGKAAPNEYASLSPSISPAPQTAPQTFAPYNPSAVDPYQGYGDLTLQERLRAAGVRI